MADEKDLGEDVVQDLEENSDDEYEDLDAENMQVVFEVGEAGAADDEDWEDEGSEEERPRVEDSQDDSVQRFTGHSQSAFCVRFGPSNLAVSGGCDDRAFIWNTTTGAAVCELSGHTDSVNAVGFSSDGKYVATGTDLSCLRNRAHSRSLGGLDATVRVYTVVDGKHVITLEGPSESIEVCRECLCVL